MKRILYITLKDLQQNLRERSTFLFLLIMPVAFTLLFGVAFGGIGGSKAPKDTRLPVGYLDQDNSRASTALTGYLDQSESIRLDGSAAQDAAGLEGMVASGKLAAVLVVPAGFGQSVEAGQPLKLTVIADPASPNGITAQSAIQSAAGRVKSGCRHRPDRRPGWRHGLRCRPDQYPHRLAASTGAHGDHSPGSG